MGSQGTPIKNVKGKKYLAGIKCFAYTKQEVVSIITNLLNHVLIKV